LRAPPKVFSSSTGRLSARIAMPPPLNTWSVPRVRTVALLQSRSSQRATRSAPAKLPGVGWFDSAQVATGRPSPPMASPKPESWVDCTPGSGSLASRRCWPVVQFTSAQVKAKTSLVEAL
jgi:hypothetical protein